MPNSSPVQPQLLSRLNEAFVLVPIALYLAVAIANPYQVGVRHLLPLYPYSQTNILSGNTFTTGNVDVKVRHSEGASVIVGSQVGNTVTR